jgi:hypothetical protein
MKYKKGKSGRNKLENALVLAEDNAELVIQV